MHLCTQSRPPFAPLVYGCMTEFRRGSAPLPRLLTHLLYLPPSHPHTTPFPSQQDVHPKVQVTATAEGSVKTATDYKIGFGAVLG